MDRDIVRAILCSSEKFTESLLDGGKIEELVNRVPAIDSVITEGLAISFTDLIAFKVSSEAHQKYAARIRVIDTLREWVRPPMGLAIYPTFCQSNRVSKLCNNILKKYSRYPHQFLNNNISPSHLITLFRSLINLSTSNSSYNYHLKKMIKHIIESDIIHDSYDLVELILHHEQELKLEFTAIEKLYLAQSEKLIEEPLIDCFCENLKKYHSLNHDEKLKNVHNEQLVNEFFCKTSTFDSLITKISQSSILFQRACGILIAIFKHCKYSFLVSSYVQFILNAISCNQSDRKKYLVDLYPIKFQFCIFLLKIDPNNHTPKTKDFILHFLEDIYTNNKEKVLMLMLHFPKWVNELSVYLNSRIDILY
ncbi:uncharacterized protein [Chelonus insularis]|uniref:uncharacterized protein n=1 Tax=Chelonus insularis TaxID=460826 RepID=UPI00158CD190|nr:uncharacterized protein LOC118074718 [Chelonus insularis]XP_034952049.1 uncharacterized protein LOC118074718 [Chelonus insularis]